MFEYDLIRMYIIVYIYNRYWEAISPISLSFFVAHALFFGTYPVCSKCVANRTNLQCSLQCVLAMTCCRYIVIMFRPCTGPNDQNSDTHKHYQTLAQDVAIPLCCDQRVFQLKTCNNKRTWVLQKTV